ncbi:glycosyltransferase [Noviherbaspirillum sp.]|uniref:glycosyltransferase n=1 Tax=Noviherbaspirillum sp. TaxID=1926288 RepID=UPI0039C96D59
MTILRKIRVLFHVTHLRRGGGIETSLMSWLRILDRTRFSVGLSIAYPTEDMESVFRSRIPEDVAVHVLGPEPWLSHCRNLKIKGELRWPGRVYEEVLLPQVRKCVFRERIERIAHQYDVVIDYDLSLARFAHDFGKPLIGISHFSFSQRLSTNRRKYRTAARYYQRYDAIVTICDAMRDEGRKLFPMLADRFTTLYPGFDMEEIDRRANEPADSIPDQPYIVSVTRLEETQKDVATLIKAFAYLVKQQAIEETMLIVGEGRHRAELESLAAELGVSDRIKFFGFTTNPLPYIRNARLKVLSSKFEGLPTVLIEGLIVGQILVSSDCPTGPREILNDGKAGLLAPVGDVEALAKAMLLGLQDGELRNALTAQAAQHATTFGVSAFGNRFEQLVQRMFAKAA